MNKDLEDLIIVEDNIEDYKKRINKIETLTEDAKLKKEYNSRLVSLMTHMLKYKYNGTLQTNSWISTIMNENNDIREKLNKKNKSISSLRKNLNSELDNIYSDARKNMLKNNTEYVKSDQVPKERLKEFTLENLTNKEYIENFLKDNVSSREAKESLIRKGIL